MQVSFARLDGKVLFEWADIVAVIPQFACSLYKKRGGRVVFHEIIGITDVQQVGQYLVIGSVRGRNVFHGSTPLPKRKGVFQHRIVVYLFDGGAELITFFRTILFEERK